MLVAESTACRHLGQEALCLLHLVALLAVQAAEVPVVLPVAHLGQAVVGHRNCLVAAVAALVDSNPASHWHSASLETVRRLHLHHHLLVDPVVPEVEVQVA
jgi:hypothetical protein